MKQQQEHTKKLFFSSSSSSLSLSLKKLKKKKKTTKNSRGSLFSKIHTHGISQYTILKNPAIERTERE
jgi:hypothetical protein